MHQTLGSPAPIVSALPPPFMWTVDGLQVDAIVQFMAGQDADLFREVEDYTAFIQTHLMPPLSKARAGDAADAPAIGGAAHASKLAAGGVPPCCSCSWSTHDSDCDPMLVAEWDGLRDSD